MLMSTTKTLDTTVLIAGLVAVASLARAQDATSAPTTPSQGGASAPKVPSKGGVSTMDAELSNLMGKSLEELLDTPVTTASRSEDKESDAPGVMAVVTKDELRRFGGTSLKDILNRVPSLISSSTSFSDRTTVAARGDQIRMNSGHVLILINGRPTRESLQGGVSSEILQAFPINVIERIEVIRGPGSALHGSNAFSAVINIIVEDAQPGARATVSVLGGLPGSYGEATKANARLGDLGILVSSSYLRRANWDTVYRYSPSGTAAVLENKISIPDARAGAYLGLDYKGLRLTSTYNQWDTSSFFRGTIGENRWQRVFGDLGYRTTVLEKLKWDMEFHATYTHAGTVASASPNTKRQSDDCLGEWINFLRIHDTVQLVAGGLYNFASGKETYVENTQHLTVADASRNSGAIFAQVEHRTFDSLKLIGGIQVLKMDNVDPHWVPRAGIIWTPINHVTFKGLYGRAFRAPSIAEIGLRHPELWGQRDLRPEQVQSFDVGANYWGERISAGVNYFNTSQYDIIMIDTRPTTRFAAPSYYSNLGEIAIQGIEAEAKYYATKEVYLTGSFLYFSSKNTRGDTSVTPLPDLGAKLGVSYMSENGLTASVFDVIQGPWHRTYAARLNPDPKAYNLLDARIGYEFARTFRQGIAESLLVFVEGQNLLDAKIYLPDWGGVTGESIPVNAGRVVYGGLSMTLPQQP